jgi:hypothetical protein
MGLPDGWIRSTTKGVAQVAKSIPRAAAIKPSITLSAITRRTSRPLLAPNEKRRAISPARNSRPCSFAAATAEVL